jgi:hypothetical protein
MATLAGGARAADHDDTNLLKALPRHDARITDLHVFTRVQRGPWWLPQRNLVLALSTNPTIPPGVGTYVFPSDLQFKILIDTDSEVDFNCDPEMTAEYGGKILDPDGISADIVFTVTFNAAGEPRLRSKGLDRGTRVSFFAGLRDDPFIRGPRQGRNVASMVIELPLRAVTPNWRHSALLVWATSSVPTATGPTGDLGARALRSQFAENLALNDYPMPADHQSELGLIPDVVIYNTLRPAAFPNGRELGDDVVDLVGDPRVLGTDCPVPSDPLGCNPTTNDRAFLRVFPYLAPPHGTALVLESQ